MRTKNTSADIKHRNKIAVFRKLIELKETTKPELAQETRISLPTVGQIVQELQESGLVEEAGKAVSVGGRRAATLRVVSRTWVALGIDITSHHIGFSLVDLTGEVLCFERSEAAFETGSAYEALVLEKMDRFLEANGFGRDQLVGVGLSFPGIVGPDHKSLCNFKRTSYENRLVVVREENFPCPMRYFNDATAACMVECYSDNAPDTFAFLSLSNTVGGALVVDRKIVDGVHRRCGEFGHMTIVPKGRKCYCGMYGHYDPYGAAYLLAEKAGGDLAAFFARLSAGDPELEAVFEEYLDDLALVLCNIIMANDSPVIIGGYVGNHLEPYLERLRSKVCAMDPFMAMSSDVGLRTCHRKEEAAATGCAMYFLEQLIENL